MKRSWIIASLLTGAMLIGGCTQWTNDATAVANDFTVYGTETFATYIQANPADANNAAANLTRGLADAKQCLADSTSWGTTAEWQAASQIVMADIAGVIQLIPMILPLLGTEHHAMASQQPTLVVWNEGVAKLARDVAILRATKR